MQLYNKLNLLINLSPVTKPQWGKMTPKQMIEHLVWSLKTSNGKIQLKKPLYSKEKSEIAKKILYSTLPLPQNFNNPVASSVIDIELSQDLPAAIELLKEEISDYYNHYENNPESFSLHLVFGELNKTEWDLFHEKHFVHHFRQFGLI